MKDLERKTDRWRGRRKREKSSKIQRQRQKKGLRK